MECPSGPRIISAPRRLGVHAAAIPRVIWCSTGYRQPLQRPKLCLVATTGIYLSTVPAQNQWLAAGSDLPTGVAVKGIFRSHQGISRFFWATEPLRIRWVLLATAGKEARMAILIEQLLDTLLSTIGLTVLDYPTRQRLPPNGGGVRLASGFDKAKLVRALSNAQVRCFPAWRGAATDPVVVTAGSAKDLARRSAYRVGQPLDGKPVATPAILPHPPDPGPGAKSQRPRPLPTAMRANRQRQIGVGTGRTGGPASGRPSPAGRVRMSSHFATNTRAYARAA